MAADTLPAWWLYIAAGVAVLALFVLMALWLKQRRKREPEIEFEPPVVAAAPVAKAPVALAPIPNPAPTAPRAPASAQAERAMILTLESTRLSASLITATLNYRLRLTNRSAAPLNTLAIEGDLIAAHASLPPERQILQPGERLELRHAVVALAPGESTELQGELRLPLSAITAIRAGNAAYFVPLARFRIEAGTVAGRPLVQVETFVVGELPELAGAALRPFRLDLGPRNWSRVGQRAVA